MMKNFVVSTNISHYTRAEYLNFGQNEGTFLFKSRSQGACTDIHDCTYENQKY